MYQRPDQENKSNSEQLTYVNGLGFIPETPRQTEHKHLLMQYNVLLFAILFYFFLRTAIQGPVSWFTSILQLRFSSELAVQISSILQMILYMGLPVIIVMLYNRRTFNTWKMFRQPNKGTIRHGLCIIIGIYALGIGIGWVFIQFMKEGGMAILLPAERIPSELTSFILYFFSVTLLPSFLQELLFRGVILHSLRRFGDTVSLIASTVLYMLVQPTIEQMVQACIMGLILGYFTLRAGSIWVAVVGSFSAKCIIVLVRIAGQYTSGEAQTLNYIVLLLMLLTGIIAFILFVLHDPQAFNISHEDTYLTNRTKVKMLFSNLGFWMSLVLALLYMIQFIQIIG